MSLSPDQSTVNRTQLPTTRNLNLAYALSLLTGLLMAGVSLGGLLFPGDLYPTAELHSTYVPNDVVNLFIGLPVLLASMWLTRRETLVGLLFWPGALLYVLYNYIAYVFGMPFSTISFIYIAIVLLSAYVLFDLLRSIDQQSVQARLSGAVPVKLTGWVLILFGVFFFFRAVVMIVQPLTQQTTLPVSEVGVLIADLVLSTFWFAGGFLMLRRMPLGYVSGLGLLFSGSMLFIGLIIFLLLQPVLIGASFQLVDVLVVLAMGMICFIPFFLFLRGTISK